MNHPAIDAEWGRPLSDTEIAEREQDLREQQLIERHERDREEKEHGEVKEAEPPIKIEQSFPGSLGIADYHLSDGTYITCHYNEIKERLAKLNIERLPF